MAQFNVTVIDRRTPQVAVYIEHPIWSGIQASPVVISVDPSSPSRHDAAVHRALRERGFKAVEVVMTLHISNRSTYRVSAVREKREESSVTEPTVTHDETRCRYWTLHSVPDDDCLPFDGDTVGIVDEKEGGIIAYVHELHADRIVRLLNRNEQMAERIREEEDAGA